MDRAGWALLRHFDFPFTDVDGSKLILELGLDITERKKGRGRDTKSLTGTLKKGLKSVPPNWKMLTGDCTIARLTCEPPCVRRRCS